MSVLLALGKLGIAQEVENVTSASIKSVQVDAERESVRFDIRNGGTKRITGFEARLIEAGANGEPKFCNEGGQDMLDWSDPMPGTQWYVHMHRAWIDPNKTLKSERYFLDCYGLKTAPEEARVELIVVVFEDGTCEGGSTLRQFFFTTRKAVLDERLKWLPRFVALKSSSDLHADVTGLYRDLTAAKYSAESDLVAVQSNGMIRATLEELQRAARQIAAYSENHKTLEPGTIAAWLITDLEQRTERLSAGMGSDTQGNAQIDN